MNLQIISGRFKGRKLSAPSGSLTHPMGSRVRSAMFNIIGDEVNGADVLDAFAGSGSIGLEALSRGAKSATFIERDKNANRIINDNIEKLGVGESSKSIRAGVSAWSEKNQDDFFDIIFADPPYNDLQLSTVFKLAGMLKSNGLMVLSYSGRGELPTVHSIVVVDNRSYGEAALAFYRKK
jgi:16S rRNA (guanine966-N2)-methyltransferase